MTPPRLLVAALCAAAVLATAAVAFGCNSDSSDDPSPTTTLDPAATATGTPRPLATLTGQTTPLPTRPAGSHDEALLTADELGEGWSSYPVKPESLAASQTYCGERIEPLPVDSYATFINTDAKRTLYQAIITLESDDAAASYIDRLTRVIHDCPEWTSGEGENVTQWKTTGSGAELGFGDSNIEQVATTQLPDRRSPSATYSIVVRDGATLMVISMFMDGPPDDTAYPVAQYAWEKLTGEDVSDL